MTRLLRGNRVHGGCDRTLRLPRRASTVPGCEEPSHVRPTAYGTRTDTHRLRNCCATISQQKKRHSIHTWHAAPPHSHSAPATRVVLTAAMPSCSSCRNNAYSKRGIMHILFPTGHGKVVQVPATRKAGAQSALPRHKPIQGPTL